MRTGTARFRCKYNETLSVNTPPVSSLVILGFVIPNPEITKNYEKHRSRPNEKTVKSLQVVTACSCQRALALEAAIFAQAIKVFSITHSSRSAKFQQAQAVVFEYNKAAHPTTNQLFLR